MTYSLSNNCTKNYYNRTLTVHAIVEDVVTWIFFETQCILPFFSTASDGTKAELEIQNRTSLSVFFPLRKDSVAIYG